MDREYKQINDILVIKIDRIITDEDRKKFYKVIKCWIYNRKLKNNRV